MGPHFLFVLTVNMIQDLAPADWTSDLSQMHISGRNLHQHFSSSFMESLLKTLLLCTLNQGSSWAGIGPRKSRNQYTFLYSTILILHVNLFQIPFPFLIQEIIDLIWHCLQSLNLYNRATVTLLVTCVIYSWGFWYSPISILSVNYAI